ncbi:MAG: PAS-domain containing protein [Alphaproteobacteria bacterium]|nr:PAS-domain containing protein [Alphaproteobacteria bacterium]
MMVDATLKLLLTILEIACFCVVLFLYFKVRRQKKRYRFENDKLTEILSTSPSGFFYFLPSGIQICSRRLAVLLGVYESKPSFEIILKKLSTKSQNALQKAVFNLSQTGKEFHLKVSTAGENIRLNVLGVRATTLDGVVLADVLWFSDQTDLLAQNEILKNDLKNYRLRDELFTSALDGLPFAFWLRNYDLSLAYCNPAYLKLAHVKTKEEALKENMELSYEAKDKMGAKLLAVAAKSSGEEKSEVGSFIVDKKTHQMQITEIPLGQEKEPEERFTMGFVRDIQNEQALKLSLENYLKAQYQVLGALSSGIVIFDAAGYVQFYNKAFSDLWKLPEEWLLTGPSYAGILEQLHEKRLLLDEVDFVKYKHKELEQFSTLTTLQEDILYLPSGRIYKRMMNPYPLGGVVMTFDDVSDKVSMERMYNAQLSNQQSILNEMPEALLIFGEEGRLKLWNAPYEKLFEADKAFLQTEPLLMDVLESQKSFWVASDDLWDLVRQKILTALENEEKSIELTGANDTVLTLKMSRLPDGGMMCVYSPKKD